VLYFRSRVQKDRLLHKWIKKTFFIRTDKGSRDYGSISRLDRLLILGVFNHETKTYQEWAFNDEDQEAMFKEVFLTFVSLKERKRLLQRLINFAENQKNHTLKPYTLPWWIYQENMETEE